MFAVVLNSKPPPCIYLPVTVITQHAPLPSALNAPHCVRPPPAPFVDAHACFSLRQTATVLTPVSCRGSCVDEEPEATPPLRAPPPRLKTLRHCAAWMEAASLSFHLVQSEGFVQSVRVVSVGHRVSVTPEAAAFRSSVTVCSFINS